MSRRHASKLVIGAFVHLSLGALLYTTVCRSQETLPPAQLPPVEQPPAEQPPAADQAPTDVVELRKSFEVPHEHGERASHTPCVVFTPDGKRMVTVTSEGELVEFDVKSNAILRRFKLPEGVTHVVALDPQARILVAAVKDGVAVIEVATGKTIKLLPELKPTCVAVSSDATRVAITQGPQWEVRALPTLDLLMVIPGHEQDITNVVWSLDGSLVGATSQDGRIVVYDVNKQETRYTANKGQPLYAIAFEPENRFVIYGGNDKQVYEFEFATEKEQVISQNQPFWITCLGFSPDGKIVAVGDESCDIWLYDREKRELIFHNKHHVECWLSGVAFATDNESFLFSCRPNSLAGTPAIYAPLTLAEAAQNQELATRRDGLIRRIDEQLPQVTNEEQRAALNAIRESLVAQSKSINYAAKAQVAQQPAQGFGAIAVDADFAAPVQQLAVGDIQVQQLPAAGQFELNQVARNLGPAPLPIDKLPEGLQQVVRDYQDSFQKEVTRLQSNHCINQWRVKRK